MFWHKGEEMETIEVDIKLPCGLVLCSCSINKSTETGWTLCAYGTCRTKTCAGCGGVILDSCSIGCRGKIYEY